MRYSQIPDWSRLRGRYLACWDNKVLAEGVIAQIQNPNPKAVKTPPEPWMAEASESKYLNPEKLYRLNKWKRTFWNWHADLFQYAVPTYGPNVFAGFCGGKVVFGADTVWHEPVISTVDEFPKIYFNKGCIGWKALLESVDYFIKNHIGEMHLGLADFGGPADWISTLMGTENFLVACAEEPEKVAAFALRLAEECNEAYDIIQGVVGEANDGSVNWMPVWSPERMGTVQDDLSINLSPRMYVDIFLPAIRCMSENTEKTVLHWHDGCAHHIDWIVAEDAIDLVQFGHDPNTGPFRGQLGQMRKIQASGKKLFISCVDACDAEFFVNNLDPRGLMMIVDTDSDDSSRRMREDLGEWTRRRLDAVASASG